VVSLITRCLRLDTIARTHEGVLARSALQALATVEIDRYCRAASMSGAFASANSGVCPSGSAKGGEEDGDFDEDESEGTHGERRHGGSAPVQTDLVAGDRDDETRARPSRPPFPATISWPTFWHYETHGECALVRLTAADCLLRLSLLLPGEAVPQAEQPVLALALRLSEARSHAPLEQLWLWSAMHTMLTEPSHEEGVRRERERLDTRGDQKCIAAVQLLWHAMTLGSAGHAKLRFKLCDIWRCLFGEKQPGCLPFLPQTISYDQVLPGYLPLHTIKARRRALAEERRVSQLGQGSLKVKLHVNDMLGAITRFDVGAIGGSQAAPFSVRWRAPSVTDARVAAALPRLEDEYRKAAEKWISFANVVTVNRNVPGESGEAEA
jgi:hypothetical protein